MQLINELNFLLEDTPECDITDKERERYKQVNVCSVYNAQHFACILFCSKILL